MLIPSPAMAETGSGILKITSTPSGATVMIDGQAQGRTPVLLELTPGKHRIELVLDGYEKYVKSIVVTADKVTKKNIKLKKSKNKKTPPAKVKPINGKTRGIVVHTPEMNAEPGTILLATTPANLQVYIDGFLIPKTTPVAFDIKPGVYELVLRSAGGDTVYRKTIFVRPGATLDLNIIVKKQRTIDYSDPWS